MTRSEALEILTRLSGPLGPWTSVEEREQERKHWLEGLSPGAMDVLLDIVDHSPSLGPGFEFFEDELASALGAVGRQNPSSFVQQVEPRLANPASRPVLIDALGVTGSAEVLGCLSSLIEGADLSEGELIQLAGALGMIGGAQAGGLLDRMRSKVAHSPAVLKEIETSRQILAYDQREQKSLERHLTGAVACLGQSDEASFREHATPLLKNACARPRFIELLRAVRAGDGLVWLSSMVVDNNLPADDIARVAMALAEAKGREALPALESMLRAVAPGRLELVRQLEPAVKAAASSVSPPAAGGPKAPLPSLVGAMASLRKYDGPSFQRHVAPLVEEPRTRIGLLEMLGTVQSEAGLAWMSAAMARVHLADEELVRLSQLLGEAGGAEARVALERMRATVGQERPRLLPEIEEALKAAQVAYT